MACVRMMTDTVSLERLDVGTENDETFKMLLCTLVGWIIGVEITVDIDRIGTMLTDLMDVEWAVDVWREIDVGRILTDDVIERRVDVGRILTVGILGWMSDVGRVFVSRRMIAVERVSTVVSGCMSDVGRVSTVGVSRRMIDVERVSTVGVSRRMIDVERVSVVGVLKTLEGVMMLANDVSAGDET